MSDRGEIQLHLTGSPSVEAIARATSALVDLVNIAAEQPLRWQIRARCKCDGCGAHSEPVDLSNPDAAETALRDAGWSRDPITSTDLCPTCATGGSR